MGTIESIFWKPLNVLNPQHSVPPSNNWRRPFHHTQWQLHRVNFPIPSPWVLRPAVSKATLHLCNVSLPTCCQVLFGFSSLCLSSFHFGIFMFISVTLSPFLCPAPITKTIAFFTPILQDHVLLRHSARQLRSVGSGHALDAKIQVFPSSAMYVLQVLLVFSKWSLVAQHETKCFTYAILLY